MLEMEKGGKVWEIWDIVLTGHVGKTDTIYKNVKEREVSKWLLGLWLRQLMIRVWFPETGEFEDEYYLWKGENKISVLDMINLRCLWETRKEIPRTQWEGHVGYDRDLEQRHIFETWHWAGL